MSVAGHEVRVDRYANTDPDWRYGTVHVPVLEMVTLSLVDAEGRRGQGCVPLLAHFGLDAAEMRAAVEAAATRARDGDPDTWRDLARRERALAPGPWISALDMALIDLAARRRDLPAWRYLGGAHGAPVPALRIVPLKSPEEMAARAADLAAEGYRAVKIKGSGEAGLDAARIAAVRRAVGSDVTLHMDPNQAYDAAGARDLIDRVGDRLDVLEQPLPAADLAGMAALAGETLCLEADEGVVDPDSVAARARAGAADRITLKFARSHGVAATCDVAAEALRRGLGIRMGTCFGGALISLAGAHLARGFGRCSGPAEVAEFAHFEDPLHRPPQVEAGALVLPEAPGFGQAAI